jgi:MarR family transcriptional regulator, transcriptional regulator for hemolysin
MSFEIDMKRLAASTALMKAARRWRCLSKRCLKSLPITEACAEPLLLVKNLGKPVHQATLAQMAGLTVPALSRLLDQLVQGRVIARLSYPGDRRANWVRLTEEGLAVASAAEARLAELRARALAKVPDGDLDTTVRVLQAFFNAERGPA